jgi:hypothetical protein
MRATEYLFFVVMVGVVFFLMIMGINNLNTAFPESQINISSLDGDYDKISSVQERANNSLENFKTLGDEDKSWFQKIGAGIVAIPYAVVTFPIMIIESVIIVQGMAVSSLGGILPATILLALLTFLIIEIVKRFLEFFQKARA